MGTISENITNFKSSLPEGVTLVAVSKTKPVSDILEAYKSGHNIFGENRVQEISDKFPQLPLEIKLHMIGHLQTNKVKDIIDKVDMIESVDSIKLLRTINKEAEKVGVRMRILLQFHIADEESKYGFDMSEVADLHESGDLAGLKGIKLCGVMGMATFTENMEKIRNEFKELKRFFDTLKSTYYIDDEDFKEISMGMSGDYKVAIEEGSTMIRVGSTIFGARH